MERKKAQFFYISYTVNFLQLNFLIVKPSKVSMTQIEIYRFFLLKIHTQNCFYCWKSNDIDPNLKFILNPRAMLLVIGTIVCIVCYCCHRKSKMRSSLYMQHRWYDRADSNMEIYSVEQVRVITCFLNQDFLDQGMEIFLKLKIQIQLI